MNADIRRYQEALAAIPSVTEEEATRAAARFTRAVLKGQRRAAIRLSRRPGENRAQHRARRRRE